MVGDYLFVSKDQGTQALDPCDPRIMSGYKTASPLARSIADGKEWDLSNDDDALALIDSFRRSRDHAFYSAVLLRTIPRSDGYYTEPLGLAIHDKLLEDPCSVLTCCWENGCDSYDGLRDWTSAIAGEILIEHEEDPWAAFVKYGNEVERRAKTECDLQTASRANEFLSEIGKHTKRVLGNRSLDVSP